VVVVISVVVVVVVVVVVEFVLFFPCGIMLPSDRSFQRRYPGCAKAGISETSGYVSLCLVVSPSKFCSQDLCAL
jgi:hypothetical protein